MWQLYVLDICSAHVELYIVEMERGSIHQVVCINRVVIFHEAERIRNRFAKLEWPIHCRILQ